MTAAAIVAAVVVVVVGAVAVVVMVVVVVGRRPLADSVAVDRMKVLERAMMMTIR